MKTLLQSFRILLFFTLLTGVIYPLLITGIALYLFPGEAGGSLVYKNRIPAGSLLIGQMSDTSGRWFLSRPSATGYNPMPSGGSNLGTGSRMLAELCSKRRMAFREQNHLDSTLSVPAEMLFASGSGLDPHISPEAARLQVERIAQTRHFSDRQKAQLNELIDRLTEPPQWLFLGNERINVLMLNLKLDEIR
ncbi:MAG TPA: potassium-transporting ATPase subunit KdpC [Bacteroidales bacterium]|nr:potassium-transporting ATPase subunit KdpC [Bacteroidales bacterium]HPS62635.1 potassium-transporting ATPase subunit KdpC [Bacteroidales bacterium]